MLHQQQKQMFAKPMNYQQQPLSQLQQNRMPLASQGIANGSPQGFKLLNQVNWNSGTATPQSTYSIKNQQHYPPSNSATSSQNSYLAAQHQQLLQAHQAYHSQMTQQPATQGNKEERRLSSMPLQRNQQITENMSQPLQGMGLNQMQQNLFEKTDILIRPPNVYRQTLDVDNLISVCTKKLQQRGSGHVQDNADYISSAIIYDHSEDPTHKKALFIRASSFLKKGLFSEAIQDCNQLMKLDSNNAGAYYIRGCAYERLNQIDQSVEDFTTVLAIDPNHINAAYARGACENKRGNFAKAIEDYHMALEKDQERPISPGGTRKIRLKNMNYILDMPMPMPTLGLGSTLNSEHKSDNLFCGSANQSKVLNQINCNIPPPSNTSKGGMLYALQDSPAAAHNNHNKHPSLLSPGGAQQNRGNAQGKNQQMGEATTMMRQAHNDSLNSSIDSRRPMNTNGGNAQRLPSAGSYNGQRIGSINSSIDFKQQNMSGQVSRPVSVPQTPSQQQQQQMQQKQQQFATTQLNQMNDIQQRKQQAEMFHSQGYAARKKGDYVSAIEFYSKAIEILPNHFKALFNRGFAYDKVGEFDKAILDYSMAISIDPNNAFTYYNKGISLDRKGDFDEAIKSFSKAIELEPGKADFYHNRGFAYRKKRDFPNAIKDYTTAIQLDPSHFKAFYNRAFCWDKASKLDEAEKDYIQAITLQPQNISALHHLGTIREKMGGDRLSLALENFNEVLELDKSYAPSYNGRGLVWDRFFNFEEAIKDFSRAIDLDNQNAVYWHNRACCYRNMGQMDKSIEDFDKAIELDPQNSIIYSNRGLVNRKLEHFEKAIEDYSNEIRYGPPNNIKAFNNRAYCYAKLGQYQEAIRDYSRVIQLDSENIHALHNRGISYERLSQYKEAIKDFTRVIEIDPDNANAYFNRGCCYDSVGELDLAISDYSVALELDMRNGGSNGNNEAGTDDEIKNNRNDMVGQVEEDY